MPLASLRKKSSTSFLNLFTQSTDFPQPDQEDVDSPTPVSTQGESLRPESAATRSRRTSFAPLPQPESRRTSLQSVSFRPQSQQGPRAQRPDFVRLRNRHASDPQLSARFRANEDEEQVDSRSPSPSGAPAPVVGYSATHDAPSRRSFNPFSSRSKSYNQKIRESTSSNVSSNARKELSTLSATQSRPGSSNLERAPTRTSVRTQEAVPVEEVARPQSSPSIKIQPPDSRQSTSSAASFFKLSRRRKHSQEPLFPLPPKLGNPPVRFPPPGSESPSRSPTASQHFGGPSQASSIRSSPHRTLAVDNHPLSATSTNGVLAAASMTLAAPGTGLLRRDSTLSAPTSPVLAPGAGRRLRERSGTSTSMTSRLEEDSQAPVPASGRNSIASNSVGRNSIAGLRSFTSRLRHGSEPMSPRYGSPAGFSSHTNSFALSRENLVLPDREDGESAGKYFSRIEQIVPKKSVALLLSKSKDPFNNDVLRSLLRTFKFYEEPLDISLRKFLWEIDIRGEAQQIERIIEAFAERYHECNPHIFDSVDQVSFIAFSLVILHSDLFNKNNKRKMQRHEYQKNSGGRGIDDEILGYLYDNIQYTEFIAQDANEEDSEGKGRPKLRKNRSRLRAASVDTQLAGNDPYEFIIDPELKLDVLRPALKNVMNLEDTYSYLAPNGRIDLASIRVAFARPGVLQLISSRSRPEAYASDATTSNPLGASQGVVEISVVKIGIVWRKDVKKRKTRGPWQPWIAMLTQSQLYFFRNAGWIRNLLEKWEIHQKHPEHRLVYNPQIEDFKPELTVRIVNAVALFDTSYDRHKNAFVLSRPDDPFEEVLLADNEPDLHDWLAKINYASTFATCNVSLMPIRRPSSMPSRRDSKDPFYDHESTLDPEIIDNINNARKETIVFRTTAAEESLAQAKEKLEEQLRNARHLQILAPFPSKSRSELLAFGARISHRIRWARYETWRLTCQRDLLGLVISFEESGQPELISPLPQRKDSQRLHKPFSLNRLNSKGSLFASSPRIPRMGKDSPRLSVQSSLGKVKDASNSSVDQLSQRPVSSAGSTNFAGRLPSLLLDPSAISIDRRLSDRTNERPLSAGSDSLARKISTISTISRNDNSEAENAPPLTPVQAPIVPVVSTDTSSTVGTALRAPSNAVEEEPSDESHPTRTTHNSFGSPDSMRNSIRRSMRETLREPRDPSTAHHLRGRKTKSSISMPTQDESTPVADKSGIMRGEGSFRVHGKKASVITVPNDFVMHMSPEDRSRTRLAMHDDDARSSVPSVHEGEQSRSSIAASDFDSSGTYATIGTAGTSFYRDPSFDSRGSFDPFGTSTTEASSYKLKDDDGFPDALPRDLAASKYPPSTFTGKRLYEDAKSDKENAATASLFDDSSTTATPRAAHLNARHGKNTGLGGASSGDEGGTFFESSSETSAKSE